MSPTSAATPGPAADAARLTRLPDDLLARSPEEGARLVALALAARAGEARERLATEQAAERAAGRTARARDPEALHDFRVAVRRLRSTLSAYRKELDGSVRKRVARRLRKAARATNAGRDLEVQLAWIDAQRARLYSRQRPGVAWLRGRLAHARTAAEAKAGRAAGPKTARALATLLHDLPAYTRRARVPLPGDPVLPMPRFATHVAARLRAGARELGDGLAQFGALRATGGDAHAASEQAHEARLAAKRVRYVLEPLRKQLPGSAEVIAHLKELQDQLGELHDLDVLAHLLADARQDAADELAHAAAELAAAQPVPDEGAASATPTGDDAAPAPPAAATVVSEQDDRKSTAGSQAPADPRPGLAALERRAGTRRAALDGEVAGAWLAGGGAALVAAIDRIAAAAEEAHQPPPTEVERKFLLRALPRVLRGGTAWEIDQGWLPGDRLRERLRRIREADGAVRQLRTVKLGTGIARVEVEEACPPDLFDALWPLTRERRVRKRRYRVPEGPLTWEVDEFTDRALVLAEVELPSVDTPAEPPAWLAPYVVRDVTEESEYVNSNLARPEGAESAGATA